MSDADRRFAAPAAPLEPAGLAGVRLPALRFQLLLGVLCLGALVSAFELAACALLGLATFPGLAGLAVRVAVWQREGFDLFVWLTWAARASLGLFALTAGLFLAWLVQARRNARTLGMPARVRGAALWWFVPGAQLVVPFQVVLAVLHASRGTYGPAPAWLATWWLVWLASLMWLCVEVALAVDPGALRFFLSDEVGVMLLLGLAPQGLLVRPLLLAVVAAIQRAQRARRAR